MKTIIINVKNHRQGAEIVPIGTELTVHDLTADRLVSQNKAILKPAAPKPANQEQK